MKNLTINTQLTFLINENTDPAEVECEHIPGWKKRTEARIKFFLDKILSIVPREGEGTFTFCEQLNIVRLQGQRHRWLSVAIQWANAV